MFWLLPSPFCLSSRRDLHFALAPAPEIGPGFSPDNQRKSSIEKRLQVCFQPRSNPLRR
jgi:hypothetical protein